MDPKTIIIAVVAALFGGGGTGFLVSLYKAPAENRGLVVDATNTLTEAATRLVGDLDRHIASLTKQNEFYRSENAELHATVSRLTGEIDRMKLIIATIERRGRGDDNGSRRRSSDDRG